MYKMVICYPFHKPPKYDEEDMMGTAIEERTKQSVAFFHELLHADTPGTDIEKKREKGSVSVCVKKLCAMSTPL